jgi:hypothetical protein
MDPLRRILPGFARATNPTGEAEIPSNFGFGCGR